MNGKLNMVYVLTMTVCAPDGPETNKSIVGLFWEVPTNVIAQERKLHPNATFDCKPMIVSQDIASPEISA